MSTSDGFRDTNSGTDFLCSKYGIITQEIMGRYNVTRYFEVFVGNEVVRALNCDAYVIRDCTERQKTKTCPCATNESTAKGTKEFHKLEKGIFLLRK
jgi:hypothetical protein